MNKERPSQARLYFLLAWMVIFWAVNYVIGKIALREFPSLLLACLRTQVAALAILPIYWLRREPGAAMKPAEFWRVALIGFFGLIVNQVLFVVALARTSVAHTALGVACAPILVLLLAAAIGQERITWRKGIGMLIAAGGVLILQIFKESKSTATLAGDGYILLFACAFAFYSVKGKEITRQFGSLTVNTVAYVTGAMVLTPVTMWAGWGFDYTRVSLAGWASLMFMAIFPAVLSSLIYYYALTYLPASRVSGVLYLQPLLATLLAAATIGEPVGISLAIGGILILIGVYSTEHAGNPTANVLSSTAEE